MILPFGSHRTAVIGRTESQVALPSQAVMLASSSALFRTKLGGGPVVVAALGSRQSAMAPGVGEIRSQLYEVRRGRQRWLGSVMTVGSKVVCTGADPVGSAGVRGEMTALVQRCPLAGGMMPGIVHVLGGAGVRSVRVDLAATASPAMQMPFSGTAERPGAVPSDLGFTAVVLVPHEFPCGTGRLTVAGRSLAVGGSIPVYLP
jgi:hypothetical protein